MRFLADECLIYPVVRQLREAGYNVATVPEALLGAEDARILQHSVSEGRILLTQDYGFGALALQFGRPALGIVILAENSFAGTLDEIAEQVVQRVRELGEALTGKLTIVEANRTRRRDLGGRLQGTEHGELG